MRLLAAPTASFGQLGSLADVTAERHQVEQGEGNQVQSVQVHGRPVRWTQELADPVDRRRAAQMVAPAVP